MDCTIYCGGFDFDSYYERYDANLYEDPLEFNVYVPIDPSYGKEPKFCTLFWNNDQIYILVNILTSFLSKSDLENSWVACHDDSSGNMPFFIWDEDGKQYQRKTSMWIDPFKSPYNNAKGRWVEDQLNRWKSVVKAVLGGIPGAFYGRLLNPFPGRFLLPSDIAFTPRFAPNLLDLWIDVKDLNAAFVPVFEKKKIGDAENIMSFDEARGKGFRCLGTDLFGNYCTWVNPTNYEEMWRKLHIGALALKWPNGDQAQAAAESLDEDPLPPSNTDNDTLNVRITLAKILAASVVKKRDPDQKQVMGESATIVADKLWKTKGEETKIETKTEWLHRSAFHFGGIEDEFSPRSSQSWKNLIFGTREANTDMIRAESAIDQSLARYSAWLQGDVTKDEIYGNLTTVNNRTDSVARLKNDGTRIEPKALEEWVSEKKYRWLSFNLEYTWMMNQHRSAKQPRLNMSFIGSTKFDPFSQYRPLQIESHLDTALIAYLLPVSAAGTSGSALTESSNMAKSSTMFSAATALNSNDNTYDSSSKPILLFGKYDLSATLVTYTIHNPRTEADKAKRAEVATLSSSGQSLSLASVFPALADTAFESIAFQDVTFLQQNFEYDDSKGVGWHLSAIWVIGSSSGGMQPLLKDVFGVKKTALSIYGGLGTKAGWDRVLDTQSFVMEGVFAGLNYSPANIDWIHVTSIGARLFGVRMFDPFPTPTSSFRYGFGVFGTINFDVPGSVTPIEFRYDVTEFDGLVSLSAAVVGDIWENALGVKGLTLRSVEFATDFALNSPWASASFDISAAFLFQNTGFSLHGYFASKNDFSLTATISIFSLNTIKDLYEHMTNKTLVLPDIDVTIGSATVSITSEKSLTIVLQNVQVDGHVSANALLTISPSRVVIHGDLISSSITFADIELKKAFLQIEFGPASSPVKTDVSLGGEIAFLGLTFDAAVHLYKDTKGLQWTVFAELTANDDTLALKKLLPGVRGTCLENVALRQVAFIAASKEDPYLGGNIVPRGYRIHEGVQVWAIITSIEAISKMAGHDVTDLVLGAGWSKNAGFVFDIIIPNPIQLNLDTGVRTEPIKIEIHTKPVELFISTGVSVQVPGSDWLTFSISLAAGIYEARIAAEMEGTWRNPFGISSEVSISNVGLQVSIIYETGPSGFAIEGGLSIGDTSVTVALSVDEDPSRELISAQASNLSLTNLVTFARKVTQRNIPYPPDILTFSSLDIYICIAGAWIGQKFYPPGFSFSATGTIYDNDFDLSCSIVSVDVNFHAHTENFYLWKVTLKNTTLEGAVGPSRQYFKIDGTLTVDLWFTTVDVSAYFYIQLSPFEVSFHCSVSFGSSSSDAVNAVNTVQTVKLTGIPAGAATPENVKDAPILLTGYFEDGLVRLLQDQVLRLFDTARRFEQEGKAGLHASLSKEKENIDERLRQAHAYVEVADAAWQGTRVATVGNAEREIAQHDYKLNVLQQSYKQAWHRFHDAVDKANVLVQAKEYERVVQLQDIQHKVDVMERAANMRVLEAIRVEEEAQKDVFRSYGDAPLDLEKARAKAHALKQEYSELRDELNGISQRSNSDEPWMNSRARQVYDFASSVKYRGVVASTVADVAATTIDSEPYREMHIIVDNARQHLDDVQRSTQTDLEAWRAHLRKIDAFTEQEVNNARAHLIEVQTGKERQRLENTVVKLFDFRKTREAGYNKARQTIRDVEKLPEFEETKKARAYLAMVYGDLVDLQGVNIAVDWIDSLDSAERSLGRRVCEQPSVFSISDVQLKGDMSFFGAGGGNSEPLLATVKMKILGRERAVNCYWSPDRAAAFTNDVFKFAWGELRRARARAPR